MRREDVALTMLAAAGTHDYTPVQIQKAMFLLCEEAAHLFADGEQYHFRAYDYGPFDRAVYDDMDSLARRGDACIMSGWVRRYQATVSGRARGSELLNQLTQSQRDFIINVSNFVRNQSFSDLVSSIYRAYPHMRENSIFVSENE